MNSGLGLNAVCRCDPLQALQRGKLPIRPMVRQLAFRVNGVTTRRRTILICPRCRSWWDAPCGE